MTERAQSDLDGIISYMVTELCNPTAAENFMTNLENSIERICLFPKSCASVDNEFLRLPEARKTTVGRYIFYYLPDFDNRTIIALRIVFGKMNTDKIFDRNA